MKEILLTLKRPLWFYYIRFKSKDGKEEFVLKPNAFVNYKGNEGLMANPASKALLGSRCIYLYHFSS
jgi:cytochrome c-type biogenesis protein CcmF